MRKILASILVLALLVWTTTSQAQTAYGQGLLNRPNAASARVYLGFTDSILAGTGITVVKNADGTVTLYSSGGGGGVSSFSAGNLVPLFTTSVANPNSTPALSFSLTAQVANAVFAGPASGGSATPTFRSLVANDIPTLTLSKISDAGTVAAINLDGNAAHVLNGIGGWTAAGAGTVTSVSLTADPIFTVTGSPVTSSGTLDLALANESANLVFAGPSTGIPAAPTFRSLVANDIPSLTLSKISDAGTVAAVNLDGNPAHVLYGNGVFGALSSGITGITNAGSANYSLINASNPPVIALKSISAGSNVTIDDQQTNLVINASGGGGGGNGIDEVLSQLTPTSGSNTVVDFSSRMWYWTGTGAVAFRYSTNWPSTSSTGRVTQIFIPRTNYVRSVYLFDDATNWSTAGFVSPMVIPGGSAVWINARVGPPGDTNVFVSAIIENQQVFNSEITFNPAAIPGLVYWYDAGTGAYTDLAGTTPVTTDGAVVRRWNDQSGIANDLTNNVTAITWNQFGAPNSHASIKWPGSTGGDAFVANTIQNYTQPIYAFVVAKQQLRANFTSYLFNGTNSANRELGVKFQTTSSQGVYISTTSGSAKSVDTNGLLNAWVLYTVTANSSSSSIRTNGSPGATIAVDNATGNIRQLAVGAPSSGSTGSDWQGEIAEMIIYSASISGQNLTNVEEYLRSKYSLYTAPTSGGGSSSGSSIDLSTTNLTSYDGTTNFAVDFSYPAQNLVSTTNQIVFNYATNWGSSTTSRFTTIRIPPTNYFRMMYRANAATNWTATEVFPAGLAAGYGVTLNFKETSPGDTNVYMEFVYDVTPVPTLLTNFNPLSVTGCKLWIEASSGVYQNYLRTVPCEDGTSVRGWTDLSGTGNHMTNNGATAAAVMQVYWKSPKYAPYHIPTVKFDVASAAGYRSLTSPDFTALTQPNWVFMVIHDERGGPAEFDGKGSSARISCFPAAAGVTYQLYSGTSLSGTDGPANAARYILWSFKQNGGASIIRTNGVQLKTGNAGAQTPAGFTIGSDYAKGTGGVITYDAEVLVYNADLTGTSITNIENYLITKYGLLLQQ